MPLICACAELRVFLNWLVDSTGRYASLFAVCPKPEDVPASLLALERTSGTPYEPFEPSLCEKSFFRWEA